MFLLIQLVIAAVFLETQISCEFLDENRCTKFEYEYKVLQKLIDLENKNVELERKQVVLERKNEELVEIIKEQRLVMEENDKELEQGQTELKAVVKETNISQTDARIQLEAELKRQDEIQASAIEELERKNEGQDEVMEEMKKALQKNAELQDQLATEFERHIDEFNNSTTVGKDAVGFTARLGGRHKKYNGGQTIVFDSVVSNVGGGYNPGTGIFTAPTEGQYLFSMTLFTHKRYVYAQMVKNGAEISRVHPEGRDSSDPYDTASNTVVVNLNKGDNVHVKYVTSAGSWSFYLYGYNYCTFSGVLIR